MNVATDTSNVALERLFKDLSNGHEFSIDQALGLTEKSKTSCPIFSALLLITAYITRTLLISVNSAWATH